MSCPVSLRLGLTFAYSSHSIGSTRMQRASIRAGSITPGSPVRTVPSSTQTSRLRRAQGLSFLTGQGGWTRARCREAPYPTELKGNLGLIGSSEAIPDLRSTSAPATEADLPQWIARAAADPGCVKTQTSPSSTNYLYNCMPLHRKTAGLPRPVRHKIVRRVTRQRSRTTKTNCRRSPRLLTAFPPDRRRPSKVKSTVKISRPLWRTCSPKPITSSKEKIGERRHFCRRAFGEPLGQTHAYLQHLPRCRPD
jgi:hypothetical protein